MARLARRQPSSDDEEGSSPAGNTSDGRSNDPSTSPSPAASFSDKENRSRPSTASKRKSSDMAPPSTRPSTEPSSASGANKRRRLGERERNGQMLPSQAAQEKATQEVNDTDFYDPDQNEEERRAVRKGLRELVKDLNDSRSEYLQSVSTGIADTVIKAGELFTKVKQTSDATIDSRLLVSAADLGYKKTAQLALGDASAGIDVDEFVSKCITFMRQGPTSDEPETGTQRQRRRRIHNVDDDDVEDEDNGDTMNWDWLGRQACFPHNGRPTVSGFLLGPLSVEKKVRQQTQRRAREARRNPADAIRPEEIEAKDLEQESSASLPNQCKSIFNLLNRIQNEGQERATSLVTDDMEDEQVQEVLWKNDVADTGGVPLFKFCVNPKSFGQTIENLFYVSFLVKEGKVGLDIDSRGLMTLNVEAPPEEPEDGQPPPKRTQRHQAVFNLDFPTWESLVDVFDIKESLIPHRVEENRQADNTGWYP